MENHESESESKRSPPSEAPDREPEPKKPKMSTTTTDDETDVPAPALDAEGGNAAEPRKPKYKRRKIAIFFAYCGVGYQGMQKNPGAKTIEGELEEALFHAGGVPELERGKPRQYDWARSARTDKGVSAVGQVVSGRFFIDPSGFVDRLNSILPGQIRIFGYKRVTPSFNAKKFCDRRRYVYLIPVFALDPFSHRDREAVMASLGSGQEFVKCLECSERGRKVVGVMGKGSSNGFEAKSSKVQSDDSSNTSSADKTDVKHETLVSDIPNGDINLNSEMLGSTDVSAGSKGEEKSDLGSKVEAKSVEVEEERDSVLGSGSGSGSKVEEREPRPDIDTIQDEGSLKESGTSVDEEKIGMLNNKFSYGEKEKERFNRILNYYIGSHNFHNFTTRTKAEDPAAHRFIVSFNANTIVNVDGIDFVKCEVVGQSFMLHQIRKMIGLAVSIMRNCAPESLIQTAFRKDVNINVPMAPEVGLYLDECFFTSYSNKWKDSHEEVSMKAYAEEAEEFKMKYIYTHIASAERKDGAVALWLHSLNYRNYPDLRSEQASASKNGNAETSGEMTSGEKVLEIQN
ncbi:PREDICTED: tRNA pseudouridine synthase A, mitochondrial [Tarenaya hassleriana]|uniref:tRNA pseudouridine synthase A, mitochondrial n=1 Tax=Tarenaya hassleriana TaxID=28532 RepID=UPI00053C5BA8|nr:PREDICTED: tRNA pseudouridine synthase A, mitochondrial [Tarenaya hassleriana]